MTKNVKIRKIEKNIDLILKSLPILIAVFFIGSIVFNLAYFCTLNIDWHMFMSLSDYYEGSIFAIFNLLIVSTIGLGIYMFQTLTIFSARNLLSYISSLKLMIKLWKKTLLSEWKWLCIRRKMRLIQNIPFTIKRKFIKAQKELAMCHKKINSSLKKMTWKMLKILSMFVFVLFWVLFVLYLVFITNWPILIVIFFIYIQIAIIKKYYKNYSFYTFWGLVSMCYIICMWDLGTYLAKRKVGYDVLSISKWVNSPPSKVRVEETDYIFVRALNRGIIAKNEEEILFFKWEDVKYLHKDQSDKNINK